ncbi:RNA polymerase subunit sigma-70 [Parvularcula sp. ZS-1/3]|uniref:RNA polymerase subunit sigma-70 n=1 Tax=Parvularcula mediterranea TaxID=2732508 RepID=A0A7Y3RKA4_9PROT|nr:sigma factor [Parvularcula mediterranea]NNU15629.1 RNA polymerase subunit sigma-70 [Parvularcula mediterranea]
MTVPTEKLVEAAAREGRARLLAILSRRTGDLAAAEDALQAAFLKALESWPELGVPRVPDAWLLTAARNHLTDGFRKESVRAGKEEAIVLLLDELAEASAKDGLPERRLELLYACAHPAIDEQVRPQLVLNTVLGVPAEDIGRCWLASKSAMAQRLVRAKAKIKASGIPFAIPEPSEREERTACVLEAIYGALTIGGEGGALAEEAAYLASLLSRLLPNDPEAAALRALSLFVLAVRPEEGEPFRPLSERDPEGWNSEAINLADNILVNAARARKPGRFQLEAAISSARIAQLRDGRDTWEQVLHLYRRLIDLAPSLAATCGYAAALMEAGRNDEAASVLAGMDLDGEDFPPLLVVRAELAIRQREPRQAKVLLEKAAHLRAGHPDGAHLSARARDLQS